MFKSDNVNEVYDLVKFVVVLTPKSEFSKILVQEAAKQLTAVSRSVELYRAEMNRLAALLPE